MKESCSKTRCAPWSDISLYSWLGSSGLRFPRANFGFEVFIQMTDGKVTRLFLLLQTAHHYAAFKRTCNQGRQFRRIDIGTHLALPLPLVGN